MSNHEGFVSESELGIRNQELPERKEGNQKIYAVMDKVNELREKGLKEQGK